MKSRLTLTYLIFWGITLQTSFGQVNRTSFPGILQTEEGLTGELFVPEKLMDSITYINQEWLVGDISLLNGAIIRNKMIKYNGLLNELLWLEPKSKKTIKLDKDPIQSFHYLNFLGDTGVYFSMITVKEDFMADSGKIFAEEIYSGKLSLFIFHTYVVERKERYTFNGVPYQRDIYAEEPVYYFRFENNKTVGFKDLSRKRLYAYLPDQKDRIKKYLKEHPPGNTWDHSELTQFTQFLETLILQ